MNGIAIEKHVYSRTAPKYLLECREDNKPVKDIIKIEGFLKGERHRFQKDRDYRLIDSTVEWLGNNSNSDLPDDKSHFVATYLFSDGHSVLTDANVGSVLRTVVEANSREIELLYEEMEQVYNAGFIDTANGKALDLVVSILGIKRKAPTRASGIITFSRGSDPPQITASEVILYDGRESYELKTRPVKGIIAIKGIDNEGASTLTFVDSQDFVLDKDCVRWINTLDKGTRPLDKTEFSVDYVAYQKITVPSGTIISTPAKESFHAKLFQTKKDGVLTKNSDSKWETNVEAEALDTGAGGNVLAGLINVMPKPPVGIDRVINRSNMAGGVEAEDDNSLRERAKKVLDVKGKATLESLRTAIEGVEGIQSSPIMIDMPDGVPGIVRVIVDGGDNKQLEQVVENTRAAGIRVELERPRIVLLDIDVTLVISRKIKDNAELSEKITRRAESEIRSFVSSLKIGENIIANQLVSLLIGIQDIRDVSELYIRVYRGSEGETKAPERLDRVEQAEVSHGDSIVDPIRIPEPPSQAGTTDTTINENVLIEEDERSYVRSVLVRFKVVK
jgi:Baseplate J-like protein